jgi:hypothetical protein
MNTPRTCPKCGTRASALDSDLCRPCLAARVAAKRRRRARRSAMRDWQRPPAPPAPDRKREGEP